MRITLVGSRHFGVTTLEMLRQRGVDIVRVVVADGDDRLAAAARNADSPRWASHAVNSSTWSRTARGAATAGGAWSKGKVTTEDI